MVPSQLPQSGGGSLANPLAGMSEDFLQVSTMNDGSLSTYCDEACLAANPKYALRDAVQRLLARRRPR